MQVQKENLTIPQGTTYRHKLEYRYEDGTPVVLTGFTAQMQIRESTESPDVLWESVAGDNLIVEAAAGNVFLKIPAAATETWSWQRAVYDLEIVSPTGEVTRILEGRVKVTPEVTR